MKEYNYYSAWAQYAFPEENKKFLADSEVSALYCEAVNLDGSECVKKVYREGGGVPLYIEDGKAFVLKDGHSLVAGQSGSKKTRAIVKPTIIAEGLRGNSLVINDIKGEITGDPIVMNFLKERGYEIYCLDFRNFNKSGFNFFQYPLELLVEGKANKASKYLSEFAGSLVDDKKTVDDFWNDSAVMLISALSFLILQIVVQKEKGRDMANMASLISFINGEQEHNKEIFSEIAKECEGDLFNPASTLVNIYNNPEKTFSCIISSTLSLLKEFISNEDLSRMMAFSSFDVKKLYKKKTCIAMIIPDETNAFDRLAGFVFESIYQQLIEEYENQYEGKKQPKCDVHFLIDEFCNTSMKNVSHKISASRSRHINFTLVYQSDKQLEDTYPNDAGAIKGNCSNHIFLGSTDFDMLKKLSESTGESRRTPEGEKRAVVSVEDLRKMKKGEYFKDALLIRDNYLYCAKLMDYERYPNIQKYKNTRINYYDEVKECRAYAYTPNRLATELVANKLFF